MGKVDDVVDVLGIAITTAINNAGITVPAQGYQGWPSAPELTAILNQAQYAYSVYPLPGGRRLPPRGKDITQATFTPSTVHSSVTASGATSQITLWGTPGVYNFYIVFVHPIFGKQYVYYRSLATDTIVTIASALAGLFSAVPSPVTATSSGSIITVSNATLVHCNIGSTGTINAFQSRFEQRIQVSVWTPNAYQNTGAPSLDTPKSIRAAVCDAIANNVGTDMNMWYTLPDNTDMRLRLMSMPVLRDDSQSDYNVYEAHMIYLAEYVLKSTVPTTQVELIDESITIDRFIPISIIGG
jgi:hypothetical protein